MQTNTCPPPGIAQTTWSLEILRCNKYKIIQIQASSRIQRMLKLLTRTWLHKNPNPLILCGVASFEPLPGMDSLNPRQTNWFCEPSDQRSTRHDTTETTDTTLQLSGWTQTSSAYNFHMKSPENNKGMLKPGIYNKHKHNHNNLSNKPGTLATHCHSLLHVWEDDPALSYNTPEPIWNQSWKWANCKDIPVIVVASSSFRLFDLFLSREGHPKLL